MSDRITALFKSLWRQVIPGFTAFWLIYTGTYLLLILWGVYFFPREVFPSPDGMLIGGMAILYIFLIYSGFSAVKRTFTFALEMNAARKEYYAALAACFLLLAGLSALLQTAAYLLLEVELTGALAGIGEIYYFSFYGMDRFSVLSVLWIHFMVGFALLTAAHTFGILYYRWGKLFLYPALAAGIFGLMNTSLLWWIGLFMIEQVGSPWLLGAKPAAVSALALLVGWFTLRRAPVKS